MTLAVNCTVCDDTGFASASFVFGRESSCTCGAGPFDELTLHAVDCDSVPCPFGQLASQGAA